LVRLLWALLALILAAPGRTAAPATEPLADASAAAVLPGRPLLFPRDHGSHADFRTEWWYVTGWLQSSRGPIGFQITFFRSRTPRQLVEGNPSAFTPSQLLIAHAAMSDPANGRLRQEQRVQRAGLGLAGAEERDTHVWMDRWQLVRAADGAYRASMQGDEFSFDLQLRPTQAPLLNGENGFSQKSPRPASASYYYSIPHLRVSGSATSNGSNFAVTGEAWLDHEWSSEYLDSEAAGWDWLGLNFDDGSALMAFRIRGKDGGTRWAGASLRDASGAVHIARPAEVSFRPQRRWRSPRTAISYPVEWTLLVGTRQCGLTPLMDDQENDTRATTGAIYWEGAVRANCVGMAPGRGYLELTGYGQVLRLR
jgi:predicted secreted hydrolase